MRSSEIFTNMKEYEAIKIVTDAIKTMNSVLIKTQASKPTVSFGVNAAESFEEILKVWNEQVDAATNELKVDVKDHVKPIYFQLPSPIDFDSVILKNDLPSKKMIEDWVFETTKSFKTPFNLIYRGSRDGLSAQNFHEKCDNKGPTIVIIENTAGKKFGGYAAVSWASVGGTIKAQESFSSFLFSVDKNQKLFYKPESNSYVLHNRSDFGPIFGGGHDLYIATNSNTSVSNGCWPGVSYQNLKEGGHISGTQNFTVKEIDVYSVR